MSDLQSRLDKIDKEAALEKKNATLKFAVEQWLIAQGLYQHKQFFYVSEGVARLFYDTESLLGLFWLFNCFATAEYPETAFVPNFCSLKEHGSGWYFPLSEKELHQLYSKYGTDNDESGIYRIYPMFFVLRESHNQRGARNAYMTYKSGFEARFTVFPPQGIGIDGLKEVEITVRFKSWEALKELGLYYDQNPKGRDRHLHPRISGWEYVHYSGGTSYLFIPEGFVWANGMGWEEDLIAYELERG